MFSEFPREPLDYNTALTESLHILKGCAQTKEIFNSGYTQRCIVFILPLERTVCMSINVADDGYIIYIELHKSYQEEYLTVSILYLRKRFCSTNVFYLKSESSVLKI